MNKNNFLALVLIFFQALPVNGQQRALKINNTWRQTPGKAGYYNWKVFIDEDASVINSIRYVEYLLHPTFKKPLQRVDNSTKYPKFSYSASGWGEFNIKVKIVYKNSSRQPLVQNYWLKLGR
jgi:transcription initiation factor IIF auxiliary subunit